MKFEKIFKNKKTAKLCEVCGILVANRKHRIVPGQYGGTYDRKNRSNLCEICHLYAPHVVQLSDETFNEMFTNYKNDKGLPGQLVKLGMMLQKRVDKKITRNEMNEFVQEFRRKYKNSDNVACRKVGKNRRVLAGNYPGGIIYGYDTINRKLIINEEEAKIVKKIFYWRYHKKSLRSYSAIARKLNSMQIKTKHDKKWHPHTIKKIIKNRCFYKGKFRYLNKKYDGLHSSIL